MQCTSSQIVVVMIKPQINEYERSRLIYWIWRALGIFILNWMTSYVKGFVQEFNLVEQKTKTASLSVFWSFGAEWRGRQHWSQVWLNLKSCGVRGEKVEVKGKSCTAASSETFKWRASLSLNIHLQCRGLWKVTKLLRRTKIKECHKLFHILCTSTKV